MHSYVLNMSLTKYQPPVLHLCALYKCILRDKSNFITSCAGWRGKSLETFSSQRCLIERKIQSPILSWWWWWFTSNLLQWRAGHHWCSSPHLQVKPKPSRWTLKQGIPHLWCCKSFDACNCWQWIPATASVVRDWRHLVKKIIWLYY